MRYILTYSEIKNEMSTAKDNHFNAVTDTEAIDYVRQLLSGKEATDITLWRRGDFVILGREGI